MNKAERLKYMRKRFPRLEFASAEGIIPFSKRDVVEETALMDSFREYERDRHSAREDLTSDER